MTYLVACLTTGKGSWKEVIRLIKGYDWEKIFLITNKFGFNKFKIDKGENIELILINPNDEVEKIKEDIMKKLKDKIPQTEVALNLFSGTGKEHMAIISALLNLGLGIRFIHYKDEEVKEI